MNATENERIRLRAVEPVDADLLFQWENDTDIWLISNTLAPFSRFIIQKYIESAHLDIYESKQLRLMIDAKDISTNPITIGTIDLFDFDPHHQRAGLGILISNEKYRNQGYAKDAVELMKEYAFNVLLLHQLYCNIAADNEYSIKLFSSLGFKKAGVKKDWIRSGNIWIDELMYQIINPEKGK